MAWCEENWTQVAMKIKRNRGEFDLAEQYEKISGTADIQGDDTIHGTDPFKLLPLHRLINSQESHSSNCSMIIVFKNEAQLQPTSKIKFYSDPGAVNLLKEISAGSEGQMNLPPILLNSGKVWFHFDSGMKAILPVHQQLNANSNLPCLITLIPQQWTSLCWLSETISTCLLYNYEAPQSLDIFRRLIKSFCQFYTLSNAPTPLRRINFALLNRAIYKCKHTQKMLKQE